MAGIGILIGTGEYFLAFFGALFTMLILVAFKEITLTSRRSFTVIEAKFAKGVVPEEEQLCERFNSYGFNVTSVAFKGAKSEALQVKAHVSGIAAGSVSSCGVAQMRSARAFILIADRCAGRTARNTSEAIKVNIGTMLPSILVLALLGVIPTWPHSKQWGYGRQRRSRIAIGNRVDSFLTGRDIAIVFHRADCGAYNRSK